MFVSAVMGTAVGQVLLFALSALLSSGVTEAISNLLQLRAKYLSLVCFELAYLAVALDDQHHTHERLECIEPKRQHLGRE